MVISIPALLYWARKSLPLCYNFPHMPNFNAPKKRVSRNSVDGILTGNRRRIGIPNYYRGASNLPEGFTPAQTRRRPIVSQVNPETTAQEETPKKADLPQTNTGDEFVRSLRPEKREKAKKEKKKREPGRLRSWWKNRSRKFKVLFVMTILLLGLGGLLGARMYSFLHSVFAKSVGNASSAALNEHITPDKVNTEGDGRLNVLILGRGGEENDAPNLTDTIIIASIDLETKNAALLSIPRDMWIQSNGYSSSKINSVYNAALEKARYKGMDQSEAEKEGVKAAIDSSRVVAGVPIHKYVLLDFKAFRDVVNALGGVDITVPEAINDYYTNYYFKAGKQHMDGARALQYARSRHGSARGDFDRSERQRQLLVAMRDKASSTGIVANPLRLNSLANAIQKNVRTDLTVDEAKILFSRANDLPDSRIHSLDLAKPDSPLVATGMVGNQSVVRPMAGINDYSKIRAYVRTNMIDPFLKREAPTVAVYNGSGRAGAATLVGNVLAGYGYNVLTKDNSEKIQFKTVVVKQTKNDKPFTYRYLSQRFGTVPITDLPSGSVPAANASTTNSSSTPPQADFVIILGTDYVQQTDATW